MIWVLLQSESPWQRNDAITFFIYLCVSLFQEFFEEIAWGSMCSTWERVPEEMQGCTVGKMDAGIPLQEYLWRLWERHTHLSGPVIDLKSHQQRQY